MRRLITIKFCRICSTKTKFTISANFMRMNRFKICFLLALCGSLTGCYTFTEAPGAVGRVVDADTGRPVRGAHITRLPVEGFPIHFPPEGLPATAVISDSRGHFNLPPATHAQIAIMYLHNPKSMTGSFFVAADGYETNTLNGLATSRSFWRADLGKVELKRR
jgi:hypothetical protein